LQKFQFSVEHLVADTPFKLFIDGAEIGTFTTDEAGSAEAVFE
jgi:hypothetical protein